MIIHLVNREIMKADTKALLTLISIIKDPYTIHSVTTGVKLGDIDHLVECCYLTIKTSQFGRESICGDDFPDDGL